MTPKRGRGGAYDLAATWAFRLHDEDPSLAYRQWQSWTPAQQYQVAVILACQLAVDVITTTDMRRNVDRVAKGNR